MYEILRKSKITINHHTDIAGAYASNMRLYEATGVGTMLLTDWKENLKDLFEPGREVVAYRSPEECKDLISYYLTHDDEREAIALAGQQRTLSEHTYYCRMKDLAEVVSKHLGAGGINHDQRSN
jgi:spore maturation protein CgeB